MSKKVVYIELEEEDFKTLKVIKAALDLDWRDILIAGGVYWVEKIGGEEKVKETIETKIKLLETLEKKK
ncbi:MAG TPA: hypothetical protein ENF67_01600 [Candidatus Pacearchaeota archaeon]|nr:hypothetical protein [Candidatus Pacearchaeota archaeon]